jgi:hypothetical protein
MIHKSRLELHEGLISRIPSNWKARYTACLSGEATYAKAVKTKCAECCGFEEVSTRVRECATTKCPLWHLRPFQVDEDIAAE